MNNEPDYDNLYFEEKKMHTPQVGDIFARIDETKVSKRRITSIYKCCDGDVPLDNDKVIEVLAKVPSYEEYERILVENDNLKQTRDALDCAVTQLREDITDYKETIDEQERELSDSAFREDNLEKEKAQLTEQLIQAKQSMSQALNYLACMDRISDTEPNEQLAFDVLRKCLEELENA